MLSPTYPANGVHVLPEGQGGAAWLSKQFDVRSTYFLAFFGKSTSCKYKYFVSLSAHATLLLRSPRGPKSIFEAVTRRCSKRCAVPTRYTSGASVLAAAR